MFGRVTIRLGIGPHSSFSKIFQIKNSLLFLECVTVFNCSVLGANKRRQMKFRNTFCMSVRPNEFMFRERANKEL